MATVSKINTMIDQSKMQQPLTNEHNLHNTSNNQRLWSALDDLDPRLFAKLVMMSSVPAKSAVDAR